MDLAPSHNASLRLRVWLCAFVLFAGLGATWAVASPIFSVPDEPAHTVKAAALVRGDLVPPKMPWPDTGESWFRGGFTTRVDVPYSYTWQTSEIPNCYIFDTSIPASCAPGFEDDPRPATWTTYIGRYPPTFYALVGWLTLLDTGVRGIYLMRLLHVALGAALLASALVCALEARRFRLLAVGIVVATTPEVYFLTGSINPNGLEITTAICVWATLGVAVLRRSPDVPRYLVVLMTASGALLAFTRPLSTLWLAAIVVIVLAFFADRHLTLARLRHPGVRIGAATVGVVAVVSASWTLLTDALGNNSGDDPRGLGVLPAAWHSLSKTGAYLSQLVAVFGWRSTPSPELLYWLWGALAAVLVVLAVRVAPRRMAVGVVVALAAVVLAPTLLQAPTARQFGFPWSGRYGLPLAVGLPIIASLAISASDRLDRRAQARVAAWVGSTAAFVHVAAHVVSTRRYVVGKNGPLLYFTADGWAPPLPAWLLLVSVTVAAFGLARLVYWVVVRAPDSEPAAEERRSVTTAGSAARSTRAVIAARCSVS